MKAWSSATGTPPTTASPESRRAWISKCPRAETRTTAASSPRSRAARSPKRSLTRSSPASCARSKCAKTTAARSRRTMTRRTNSRAAPRTNRSFCSKTTPDVCRCQRTKSCSSSANSPSTAAIRARARAVSIPTSWSPYARRWTRRASGTNTPRATLSTATARTPRSSARLSNSQKTLTARSSAASV